jgi:hypothetical protein
MVQKNKHNFWCDIALELDAQKFPSSCCVPVIYVCFPLASCVSHVFSPNDLANYQATCEAWSQRETTELK